MPNFNGRLVELSEGHKSFLERGESGGYNAYITVYQQSLSLSMCFQCITYVCPEIRFTVYSEQALISMSWGDVKLLLRITQVIDVFYALNLVFDMDSIYDYACHRKYRTSSTRKVTSFGT